MSGMIDYKEAQAIILQHARSFGEERVSLDAAAGRVLAERILSDRDYPPFNRATMDGYAIRYTDWEQGVRRFEVVETIFAGATHSRPIGRGQCYKIMTGAPVPEGADMVVRREDTEEGSQVMELRPGTGQRPVGGQPSDVSQPTVAGDQPVRDLRRFLNIAKQGEDLRSSDTVIDRPCLCEPPIMGLLASLGKQEVMVSRLPGVAILTTGNEIAAVDEPVNGARIRNSNLWLLRSSLKKWSIDNFFHQHVPDDRSVLQAALENALPSDLIILSGGVSAGDADYVPGVLEACGVERLFHKIAIKPGRPVWCGLAPGGGMVFALPGNPFSCLVGFVLLIQPWLHTCFGLPVPAPLGLPLQAAKKKNTPLDEFFPVRMSGAPAGLLPVALNGSGDIRMGLEANALALHPAESGDLVIGDQVLCYLLG